MDIKKNSENIKVNSDFLVDLPTDKNQPTHTEIKVINTLFEDVKSKENFEPKNNLYKDILKYAFLIFLFMIIYNIPETKLPTLPFINNYEFAPILMKAIILAVGFYFIETKLIISL
jgi:hypothetical protein